MLSCKHPTREWRQKAINIGYRSTGLGRLIRRQDGSEFYCRWVVLCWWCRVRRWVARVDPMELAALEMEWTEEGAGKGKSGGGGDGMVRP